MNPTKTTKMMTKCMMEMHSTRIHWIKKRAKSMSYANQSLRRLNSKVVTMKTRRTKRATKDMKKMSNSGMTFPYQMKMTTKK